MEDPAHRKSESILAGSRDLKYFKSRLSLRSYTGGVTATFVQEFEVQSPIVSPGRRTNVRTKGEV